MRGYQLFSLLTASILLSGCAGMNSDFEFDKPARDSGIWMSQADDMTATHNGNTANKGDSFNLAGYRLINTGNIRLDVRPTVSGGYTANQQATSKQSSTVAKGAGLIAGTSHTAAVTDIPVSCNTPRCYPEPSSAFRTPDAVIRIWIAPFVSPDDNVHMGEIVYSVAKPAHWNGML
ncbi:type IV conjugative transfer system lipoprotein TraV [Serratia sp. UGAL515B_01]|uniref:type IV conjugative transfer system lipoprotein TraV n=1 Tax=Serratia sp. UGAL515B_01 TaxID=2986763 RepID=UPI0029554395|nr:type IV conjugative transfer system lipoprotein TraV [Serratia sp. UGAL515B_01]WON75526.1 type IV conjugative transfer system lipoprotein TraV [Serratia sp. UGAL515B_01]